MAGVLGHVLGSSHRRGHTADGGDAAAVLEADLTGNAGLLQSEIAEMAAHDFATHQQDYQRFRDLRRTHGPLLGADDVPVDLSVRDPDGGPLCT